MSCASRAQVSNSSSDKLAANDIAIEAETVITGNEGQADG
jgi:hypothetical protein